MCVCVRKERESVGGYGPSAPQFNFPSIHTLTHTHTQLNSARAEEREMRSAFIMETVCVYLCERVCRGDFQIPAFASLHLFF